MQLLTKGAGQGVEYLHASVHFRADGRLEARADKVHYGFITIHNLYVVGRVNVADCRARFVVEEVKPGGLVTAFIPSAVNQALQEYSRGYCVEDVTIRQGKMVVTVRPE